jgi:hypothetical protein
LNLFNRGIVARLDAGSTNSQKRQSADITAKHLNFSGFHNASPWIKWTTPRTGEEKNATLTHSEVMIGEKVGLKVEIPTEFGNCTIKWDTPDGQTVKSYHLSVTGTEKSCLGPADLTKTNMAFYWIAPGTDLRVGCTLTTASGREVTVRAGFDARKPKSTLDSYFTMYNPPVAADNCTMRLGTLQACDLCPGITVLGKAGKPAIGGGTIGIIQLIEFVHAHQGHCTGAPGDWLLPNPPVLDKVSQNEIIPDSIAAIPSQSKYMDSPSMPVCESSSVCHYGLSDVFADFLMFRPDTPESIWVTLRRRSWSWSASYDWNEVEWAVNGICTANPPSSETATLPEWQNYWGGINPRP